MDQLDRFVDTHVHFWELGSGWYPGLEASDDSGENEHGVGSLSKIRGRDFLLSDYHSHAKGLNVTKLVHVTAAHAPPSMPHETRWIQSLSDSQSVPIAIVGKTDLGRPLPEIEAELAEHAKSPNFRGIRNEEGIDFTSEQTALAFAVMERRGLLYDTVAHEDSLPAAANLARRFPEMSFVLEHTGWPTSPDRATFEKWRAGMQAFAAPPNTSCKISGLGMVMHEWTVEDFRPWVQTAIECFGVSRCMFGTNFPVDWIYSSYERLMDAFLEITSDLAAKDRDAIFAANAERVYRI